MITLALESNFFTRVYSLVALIPHGKVASYGQIAALLDQPRAARTVGWALSQLPEQTEVPWHRVINSKGRVSIKSAQYTAALQQGLLEQEGVFFDKLGSCNLAIYQWQPDLDLIDEAMGKVDSLAGTQKI